jgi:S1-C subfamily serine protease
MDLEHLNKSQIVLLTLLVSFVTSVATGIVTVTLLEEAPPVIAQTVNRVVERTVERVVPSGQTAGASTVTEKTVVVKESDLIAQSVETVAPSVVRLFASGGDSDVFLGLGLIVKDDGTIVTDAAVLPATGPVMVSRADGVRATSSIVSRDADTGLALLQGATSTAEGPLAWHAAQLSDRAPTLGKVVVGISGKDAMRIGDGIVTAIPAAEGEKTGRFLETNVPSGAIAYGSPLVNADGWIEGISTSASRAQSENAFLASSVIIVYTTPREVPAETEKPAQ